MKYLALLLLVPLLVSCDSQTITDASILNDAKNTLDQGKTYVDDTIEHVDMIRKDVEDRVQKVSEGIDAINEGKSLIGEGLTMENAEPLSSSSSSSIAPQ